MKLAMYALSLTALAVLTQPAQAGKCWKSQVARAPRHYVAAEAEKPKTIVETAAGIEDFSTLVAAVKAGGLVETLSGKGPFTVFAPTNDAFASIQDTVDTLLMPENKDDLKSVLTYHVVPGELKAADLTDGQELETVNGEKLTVSVNGDTVKVGDATVTTPDVDVSNGVVHVIDQVLVPPAGN